MRLKSKHLESLWITDPEVYEVQTGDVLGLKALITWILCVVLEMAGHRSLSFFCRQTLAASVLVSDTDRLSVMVAVKVRWKSRTPG